MHMRLPQLQQQFTPLVCVLALLMLAVACLQISTGEIKKLGPSRLYTAVAPSPDGQYLLVAWLERPFSYNVPCGRFPKRIQLWDRYPPPATPLPCMYVCMQHLLLVYKAALHVKIGNVHAQFLLNPREATK